MKIYRRKNYIIVRFGNDENYSERRYHLDLPFWLSRLSEITIVVSLIVAWFYVLSIIDFATGIIHVSEIQIELGLVDGLLFSALFIRQILVPHIRKSRQIEAFERYHQQLCEMQRIQEEKKT